MGMRQMVWPLLLALVAATSAADTEGPAETVWIPLDNLSIVGPESPTEAEFLAIRHFNREVERFSGKALPVAFGVAQQESPVLRVGTRGTLAHAFEANGWRLPGSEAGADPDMDAQSYVLAAAPKESEGAGSALMAAGFGSERTARATLGLAYALGDLLRRLDMEAGTWGFRAPAVASVNSPAVENRTIYHMVSRYASKGLSLMHYSPAEVEAYVDRLVDARYSRVTFWQYVDFALYPGNRDVGEGWRGHIQQVAQQMRRYMNYARRRGLEVYQMLSPGQVNLELLPDDPRLARKGFEGYGKDGVCWSQPEAREIAGKVCRAQMEYYGPMDGYVVWFFDPAGCFCDECRNNQAELLFSQLTTVEELSKTISPGAKMVACLWPTWCFAENKLADYSETEVADFVSAFLAKCHSRYGPRGLTILDMCEYDHTNIYNGLVSPEQFRRGAFLYGATGFHGEAANAFGPLKLRYINAQMNLARKRGVEESMIYVYFEETNFPSVFTFADALYTGTDSWQVPMRRYAQTLAKSEALATYIDLLTALEGFDYAHDRYPPEKAESSTSQTEAMLRGVAETSREERADAFRRASAAWKTLKASPHWYGNSDWMEGYLLAQAWLMKLGSAPDDDAFNALWQGFADEVAKLPMYSDYMRNLINAPFARTHWPKR